MIARTVTEQRVAIPTADAPMAYLDIYTPDGTGSKARPVILWVHGEGFISGSAAAIADYSTLRRARLRRPVSSGEITMPPPSTSPTAYPDQEHVDEANEHEPRA